MTPYDRVVRGTILTPVGRLNGGWLAIAGGRIAAVGQGEAPAGAALDDFGARSILPGAVDGQTHAGSYRGLAGIESTTRSAVAGGVTTIVDMPYDNPEPLTGPSQLEAKVKAIETLAHCDVALYGTLAKGQPATDIGGLAKAGIAALKISAFESHPTRFPRIPAGQTLDILEAAADTQLPVGLHNEDQEIVLSRIERARALGRNGIAAHSSSRPPAAELAATVAFLELGAVTGAHVHIVHFSLPRGFALVDRYRREGTKATAELCVHYLAFDPAIDGEKLGAKLKVNPPIRPGMREKLWEEFDAGRVEFVSSDHSSWPIDNKLNQSIFDAGAGIPGLETLVPAFYSGLAARGPDPLPQVAAYLAERPAKFFGLWPRKGAIAIGADADLMVLEEGAFVHDSSRAHDDLRWSPFDGMAFGVRIAATFVRGIPVFDGSDIVGPAGLGRFVPREPAAETGIRRARVSNRVEA
jgi:allantoinase